VGTSWLAAIHHTFVEFACQGIACLPWVLAVGNQTAGFQSLAASVVQQHGQVASLEAGRLLVGCTLAGFVGLPSGWSVVAVAAACRLLAESGEAAYLLQDDHLAIHCLLLTELPKEVVEGIHFDHLQNLDAILTFPSDVTEDE
jgi:hypothetical protein